MPKFIPIVSLSARDNQARKVFLKSQRQPMHIPLLRMEYLQEMHRRYIGSLVVAGFKQRTMQDGLPLFKRCATGCLHEAMDYTEDTTESAFKEIDEELSWESSLSTAQYMAGVK